MRCSVYIDGKCSQQANVCPSYDKCMNGKYEPVFSDFRMDTYDQDFGTYYENYYLNKKEKY